MRVLIAFGSRWGSTEEIAGRLAGFLGEEGVEATVLDVKGERWPGLEGFDGVIVGSGVKITRWMREPLQFLRRNAGALRGKKVALFVSCMSVLTDPGYAQTELLEKVAESVGVEPVLVEAFGPVMDVRPGSRMGFLDRRIAKTVMAGLSKDEGLELDPEGRNDLRDWDRVREFARSFAESLRE